MMTTSGCRGNALSFSVSLISLHFLRVRSLINELSAFVLCSNRMICEHCRRERRSRRSPCDRRQVAANEREDHEREETKNDLLSMARAHTDKPSFGGLLFHFMIRCTGFSSLSVAQDPLVSNWTPSTHQVGTWRHCARITLLITFISLYLTDLT
jgi:hypothetical protein